MKLKDVTINILLLLSILGILSSCKEQSYEKSSQVNDELITTPINTPKTEISATSSNRAPLFPQSHSNLDGKVSEFVRKMYQDKSGNFWFGTNGDGVIRYNGVTLEKFTIKDGFGGSAVRGIKEDGIGNVWFGTSGGLTINLAR